MSENLFRILSLYQNKAIDPVDFAELLKTEEHMGAKEIAEELKKTSFECTPLFIGEILLNQKIYPDTGQDDMKTILFDLFVKSALEILYPAEVSVYAQEPWNDTGIDVREDELVTIEYLDKMWSIDPARRSCGADGLDDFVTMQGYLLPNSKPGALVGKIGEHGEAFFAGSKGTVPKSAGRLYLGANDDVDTRYGIGYADNSGYIQVRIKKEAR